MLLESSNLVEFPEARNVMSTFFGSPRSSRLREARKSVVANS